MASSPSVSVIVPAYNAVRTIGRTVDSVLKQTYPAAEIIVIDDGSPDDIGSVLAPYGAAVNLIRQPNGGAASARNSGIEHAIGDLVAFLDADDSWEPHKLERQVAFYQRRPDLGLTASAFFTQQPRCDRQPNELPGGIVMDQVTTVQGKQAFEFGINAWTGTVMAPRSLFGSDRFVSGLEPAEDRDLWIRLVAKAPVAFLSEPLATLILEPNSLSRSSVDRDCANMLKTLRRNGRLLGPLSRAMWMSHTHYRWAACTPSQSAAWKNLFQSFWRWPFPYARRHVRMPLARPRLSLRLIRSAFIKTR
jgi:glycosyltransferase involved in cell wall biosynthesis